MGGFQNVVLRLSNWMHVVAAIALTFIMLLTVSDVVLRLFGHPIVGTFELVGLGGAVVIGFGIPITSWNRGHIFVDFMINWCSPKITEWFQCGHETGEHRSLHSCRLEPLCSGKRSLKSGEVTLTRQLPFYPVAYGLGICCFIECLVLICDLVKISGGKYE